MLPQNPEEENLISALIATNDRAFKPLLDRYKYFDRYPEFSQQSYFEQALLYLLPLEQRLAEAQGQQEQAMLLGRMSAADLAIFPFVRQFAHVDRARFNAAPLPCLTQWLQAWLEHPWFIRAMKPKPLCWKAASNSHFSACRAILAGVCVLSGARQVLQV